MDHQNSCSFTVVRNLSRVSHTTFCLTYGSRRSYGASLRLLLGAWGGRALDGGEHVGRQRGDGVAADHARLGWRGGAC
jgi:hypothetical protein